MITEALALVSSSLSAYLGATTCAFRRRKLALLCGAPRWAFPFRKGCCAIPSPVANSETNFTRPEQHSRHWGIEGDCVCPGAGAGGGGLWPKSRALHECLALSAKSCSGRSSSRSLGNRSLL